MWDIPILIFAYVLLGGPSISTHAVRKAQEPLKKHDPKS